MLAKIASLRGQVNFQSPVSGCRSRLTAWPRNALAAELPSFAGSLMRRKVSVYSGERTKEKVSRDRPARFRQKPQ